MRRRAVLALVALTGGCAGPRPPIPADAAVAPPAHWRGISDAQSAPGVIRPQWWRDFADPALNHLVEQALAGNTDLQIAAARVREARAQFALAASYLQPSLGIAGNGGRSRSLNAFGQGLDQSAITGEARISYEIDLFGRLSATADAARATVLANAFSQDALRTSLIATVVSGYVTLRALDAQLAIIRATLVEREAELALVRRRYDAGYSARVDLDQAQAARAAAAQLVPTTQAAIARQENAINALIGHMPGPVERGSALAGLNAVAVPSALPSSVLRQRPDIAEAEARLAAADHSLDAARAAFMPRINLSASGGAVGSSVLANPVSLFALGGSLLAPIYSGGAWRAGADGAAARRDQLAYAYRQTVLRAFQEVEDAMAGVDGAQRAWIEARAQEEASRELLRLAQRRYRAGYASYLEQLDAERALLAIQLQLVDLQTRRLVQITTLYRGLGGGWQPPDAAASPP